MTNSMTTLASVAEGLGNHPSIPSYPQPAPTTSPQILKAKHRGFNCLPTSGFNHQPPFTRSTH